MDLLNYQHNLNWGRHENDSAYITITHHPRKLNFVKISAVFNQIVQNFDGRHILVEDNLWLKMTLDGRGLLKKDKLL